MDGFYCCGKLTFKGVLLSALAHLKDSYVVGMVVRVPQLSLHECHGNATAHVIPCVVCIVFTSCADGRHRRSTYRRKHGKQRPYLLTRCSPGTH